MSPLFGLFHNGFQNINQGVCNRKESPGWDGLHRW